MNRDNYNRIGVKKSKMRKILANYNLDAMIVIDSLDVSYLSGYYNSDYHGVQRSTNESIFFAVIARNGPWFMIGRWPWDAGKSKDIFDECFRPQNRSIHVNSRLDLLVKSLQERNLADKKIGFDLDHFPAGWLMHIQKKVPKLKAVSAGKIMDDLRAVKSEKEVKLIRKAILAIEDAFEFLASNLRPGLRAREVGVMVAQRIASHDVLPTFCSATAEGADWQEPPYPNWFGNDPVPENGLFRLDVAASCQGYFADLQRTFLLGKVDKIVHKRYKELSDLKKEMARNVCPGISIYKLHALFDKLRAEISPSTMHSIHGVGLAVHEVPMTCYCATCERNDPYGKYIIPEGFVFASEAARGAHPDFPELGAMGEEDMYWLTSHGLKRLSSYSEGSLIKVKRS
ncbi:MAG: M24 family metallopeptidase [bacterium]